MTTLALLSWVALIAGSAMGQAPSGPRADGFRGLILNQTSAEDGIRILGQPAVDKTDRLDVSLVSGWIQNIKRRYSANSPSRTLAIFRRFNYRFSKTS